MIISFKHFLIEGGGKIQTETGEASGRIDVKKHGRREVQKMIKGFLNAVNTEHKNQTGRHMFGSRDIPNSVYAGSTQNLMDSRVSDEEFHGAKPKGMGDVDVLADRTADFGVLEKGKKYGEYSIKHVHKEPGTGITSVLAFHHPTGELHQYDFAPAHYKDNEPSLAEQLSKNSHISDFLAKIPGKYHKYMLGALPSSEVRTVQLLTPKGTKTNTVSIPTSGISANPSAVGTDDYPEGGFAARVRYVPSGTTGVYREIDQKESKRLGKFYTGADNLFKLFFNKKPQHHDLENMQSFVGSVQLIKKHFPPEHQSNIIDRFIDTALYGKDAKVAGDDMAEKDRVLDHLRNHLPDVFTPEKQKEIEGLKANFYGTILPNRQARSAKRKPKT